jgi:transposase
MIAINRRTKIYLSKDPADMRASYDTLFNKVKTVLASDPMSGHLFVFINARRTSCKCLFYDGTGLVIIAKRLEKGLFSRVNPYHKDQLVLTQAEFVLFFEGADLNKRFIDSPKEIRKNSKSKDSNTDDLTH